MAEGLVYRFSTKYTDDEAGLVYYGFRYHRPGIGRFISRDPAEEWGSYNLYAFVDNQPIFLSDLLGLIKFSYKTFEVECNNCDGGEVSVPVPEPPMPVFTLPWTIIKTSASASLTIRAEKVGYDKATCANEGTSADAAAMSVTEGSWTTQWLTGGQYFETGKTDSLAWGNYGTGADTIMYALTYAFTFKHSRDTKAERWTYRWNEAPCCACYKLTLDGNLNIAVEGNPLKAGASGLAAAILWKKALMKIRIPKPNPWPSPAPAY